MSEVNSTDVYVVHCKTCWTTTGHRTNSDATFAALSHLTKGCDVRVLFRDTWEAERRKQAADQRAA